MSHTPGPWDLGIAGNCNVVRFDGDDITGIARCHENDAPLIAAAPELLECCMALLWYAATLRHSMEAELHSGQPDTLTAEQYFQDIDRAHAAIAKAALAEGRKG